ncbi:MAG TPA: SRPBCC family protein [Solirubrobacteraceae bacterium]|nr:SRPBCC family protein [Solirubrobacteraceae bacterium]
MKLEQSFTVTAPVEQVWAMLVDVERVAPCLPGAEITGQTPEGGYEGTFSVKLGPATAAYRGSLQMESLDEASRTATMKANGTDKRGQGGAHATIVSTMAQQGEETQVDVVTDFTITGRLARFGRGGMIEDISKRLMRDFAQCLQATLAAEQAAPAAAAAAPAAAAAEAATAAPLPGQEAADEPLQPAQAPWPPRAPDGDGAAAAEPESAAAEPAAPAESAAAAPADPAAPAEPAAAAPGEPAPPAAPPRTGSVPPPTAARPAPAPAKPVQGFSLFFGVLWDRIKAFFKRLFGRKN